MMDPEAKVRMFEEALADQRLMISTQGDRICQLEDELRCAHEDLGVLRKLLRTIRKFLLAKIKEIGDDDGEA